MSTKNTPVTAATNGVSKQENSVLTISGLLEKMKTKIESVLGDSSRSFVASTLALSNSNPDIKKCDPVSVFNACMKAAVFKLETDPALSQCHIIPYNLKQADGSFKMVAQFQLGYKGIKQLCIRSNWFKAMNAIPIYAGQIKQVDPLRGDYEFDFTVESTGEPIGYAAFYRLTNGFEKTLYMNVGQIIDHAKKYSKSYKKGFGPWKDNFNAMALKTVSKLLLNSGEAPMSIEFREAQNADQKLIVDPVENQFEDIDHDEVKPEAIESKKDSEVNNDSNEEGEM